MSGRTVSEWKEDFKSFINELQLLRDDYNGIMLYIDEGAELLKAQVQEPIVHCKDCEYGLYTGTEYHCDKHSGHENRLGEDQYYKEWHNGSWFCADGKRREKRE